MFGMTYYFNKNQQEKRLSKTAKQNLKKKKTQELLKQKKSAESKPMDRIKSTLYATKQKISELE